MSVLTLPKELAKLSRPIRALPWVAVSSKKQAEEDKASLPEQEKQQRDLCGENGWSIFDVLIVPGHSRNYIDIHECAEDMAEHGVFAVKKLLKYLGTYPLPFDVFICRDMTRFGRTATMLSYVLESIIAGGGVIYSMTDGWITADNSQFANAMGGFKTTKDIRDLLARREEGMNKRLERGLNMYGLPRSHILVFDGRGKPDHLDLNPETARLWLDLKELLLARVPWKWISMRLFERGHVGEDGKRLADSTLRKLLNNPYFWGHAAKDYCQQLGPWAYDAEYALPEGVKIHRNTHPAVYTGEDAELVKAELRRRLTLVGKATSETGYAFSGLLMCDECGCSLVGNPNNGYPNWRCQTRNRNPTVTFCTQKRMISDAAVRRYVKALLEQLMADGGIETLNDYGRSPDARERIAMLEEEIASITKRIQAMITNQGKSGTSASVIEMYAEQIRRMGEQLDMLNQELGIAKMSAETQSQVSRRVMEYGSLAEMGLEAFWQQDNACIHQALCALMGNLRFVIKSGEIIGIGTRKFRQGGSTIRRRRRK